MTDRLRTDNFYSGRHPASVALLLLFVLYGVVSFLDLIIDFGMNARLLLVFPEYVVAVMALGMALGPAVSLFGIWKQDLKNSIIDVLGGLFLERWGTLIGAVSTAPMIYALVNNFTPGRVLSLAVTVGFVVAMIARFIQCKKSMNAIHWFLREHSELSSSE